MFRYGKRRLLRTISAILGIFTLLTATSLFRYVIISDSLRHQSMTSIVMDSHLVFTSGCKLPYLSPWDRSVKHHLKPGQPLKCLGKPALTYTEGAQLRINYTSLLTYYNNSLGRCSYESIERVDDGYTDDRFKFKMQNDNFVSDLELKHEYIRVVCYDLEGNMIYANFHAVILTRPRLKKIRDRRYSNHVKYQKPKEKLNVIMIGLDSMSRMNFIRQMPRTYQYLTQELGAFDMAGFNKVADNTYVNLSPMLAGKFVEELPWNENMISEPFDKYDFAWKRFAKRGYYTLMAEDYPEIAIFNYHKVGFFRQPTDYYLRPFSLAMASHGSLWNQDYHCIGDKLETEHVLDYTSDFTRHFKTNQYFAFTFITRLTHEDINTAGAADEPHHRFLKRLNDNGILENSVLIYFSDHGARFGKFRETYVGRLEERLPLMTVALPKWFLEKYPEMMTNLAVNTQRLSTPFDIHNFLMDILDFHPDHIMSRTTDAEKNRGISWFNEIPENRNCENAHILSHWCTCHETKQVNTNATEIIHVAKSLIKFINLELKRHNLTDKCSNLKLYRVGQAMRIKPNEKVLHFKESLNDVINRKVTYGDRAFTYVQYTVTIETVPGNALFEATVRYSEQDNNYSVVGEISRINLYGSQSHCVDNFNMKKFCYCRYQNRS